MAPQRTSALYPNGSAYVGALQHPQTAFTDPDLRAGTVQENVLGFPDPRSGNFASVFKVTSPTGQWAVKCFTRQVEHQQQRYAAIDAALNRLEHAALVHFNYQPEGVNINGTRYPLLKMQWVDAQELLRWLEHHHRDQEKVFHLAGQLVDLVHALEDAGIAHGDLQHGNLLVTAAGKLVLVDYDGMFVPELAGYPATEKGLPHYQHPARSDADYGPGLDRFSAWVIYTSLYAIATHSPLWTELREPGAERLLFTHDDFLDPVTSTAFTALRTLGNTQLAKLGDALVSFARSPRLDRIPALDPPDLLGVASTTIPTPRTPGPDTDQLPDWLTDHVPQTRATTTSSLLQENDDHKLPLQTFPGDSRLMAARLAIVTALLGAAGGVSGSRLTAINPLLWYLLALTAVLLVAWLYTRHPQVHARRQALQDHHDAKQATSKAHQQLSGAQHQLAEFEQRCRQHQNDFDTTRAAIAQKSRDAMTAASNVLRAALQQISGERTALGDGSGMRHAVLARKQKEHVGYALTNSLITNDPPEDINTLRTKYLAEKGIRSAADFTGYYVSDQGGRGERTYLRRAGGGSVYVKQIGKGCAANLVAWRESIEQRAERSAPKTLTAFEENWVRGELRRQLDLLDQREKQAHQQRDGTARAARAAEQAAYAEQDARQKRLQAETTSERNNLNRLKTRAESELKTCRMHQGRREKIAACYTDITGTRFLQRMAWMARR
ncbi:protein kinase domain-containing protein [Actinoplanes solisilvae]|uniref:protein kinase domain-containing protein n=1 Tax=Actinoplanes solisilvae TaxID=2486853 RepID=UPI000FD9C21F|nr:hypothetical protein [Actinoplanes solisilvae]